MVLRGFSVVGLLGLLVLALALAGAAYRVRGTDLIATPPSWWSYRLGFATYALVFLAFDMEMIFMYPWAVVFADLGLVAFLDMLVFIALLAAGIAHAWRMGGFAWE